MVLHASFPLGTRPPLDPNGRPIGTILRHPYLTHRHNHFLRCLWPQERDLNCFKKGLYTNF